MEKSKNKYLKVKIGVIISLCSLIITYLGMSMYFRNHFYFGVTINCINASGKTVEEIDKQICKDVERYTLVLEEQGSVNEEIRATDINLKYNSHDKVQSLMDNQNYFKWLQGLFNKKEYRIPYVVLYDEKLLKKCVNNLSCFNVVNIIEPKNPSFKYTDKGYEIIKESKGNKVNKDILYNHILNALDKKETKINLAKINCYDNPKYTSDSKEILAVRDNLNKYASSIITYVFGKHTEVLDGSIINKWLKVNEDFEIILDKEKVKNYVDTLADTYDTAGRSRKFSTSLGRTVKVNGGDYGWIISRNKEVDDIIISIKSGKTITKEPVYRQVAVSHGINDIGNTYVEIDLTKQYLWFYKDKSLIVKGDVVTGDVSKNHSTPSGTYKLKYKQKGATLRGVGYSVPVSFWMPFNGGIGIHDATWRSAFGGEIYRTNGSHGCVNAPYNVAEKIFNNIEQGTPVICYFK